MKKSHWQLPTIEDLKQGSRAGLVLACAALGNSKSFQKFIYKKQTIKRFFWPNVPSNSSFNLTTAPTNINTMGIIEKDTTMTTKIVQSPPDFETAIGLIKTARENKSTITTAKTEAKKQFVKSSMPQPEKYLSHIGFC